MAGEHAGGRHGSGQHRRRRAGAAVAVGPADTMPPVGLGKFDLGLVPASVTPPKTWRTAAWFAVCASVAVVMLLAFAAVALMGAPHRPDRVDALPTFPSQFAPPNGLIGTLSSPPGATTSSARTSGSSGAVTPDRPPRQATDENTAASTTAAPARPRPGTTTAPPPARSTVNSSILSPTDAQAMGDRAEQYFTSVVNDPDAAYAITTGQLRAQGRQGITQRYRGVRDVRVTKMVIDPNRSTTTCVLTVVHDDGSVATVRRRLEFSWGSDPRISQEYQVS